MSYTTIKEPVKLSNIENFFNRIKETESGCYEWQGCYGNNGYGRVSWNGKIVKAHRVAYFLANFEIDSDLTIDHLCNNIKCCNPEHMEQVTLEENNRRKNERILIEKIWKNLFS